MGVKGARAFPYQLNAEVIATLTRKKKCMLSDVLKR